MRSMFRSVLVALVAVLALGAVVSASASAAFTKQWEVCENVGAAKGHFESDLCSKAGGGDEWEWKALAAGESRTVVDHGGRAQLGGGLIGEMTCQKVTSKQTIFGGIPGTAEATDTFTECTTRNAGCKVKSAGGTYGTIVVPSHPAKLQEISGKLVENFEQNLKTEQLVTLEFSPENEAACEGEGYVKGFVTGNVTAIINGQDLIFSGPGSGLKWFGTAFSLTVKSTQELTSGSAVRAS
jgi:hypothetical protein